MKQFVISNDSILNFTTIDEDPSCPTGKYRTGFAEHDGTDKCLKLINQNNALVLRHIYEDYGEDAYCLAVVDGDNDSKYAITDNYEFKTKLDARVCMKHYSSSSSTKLM